MKVSDIKTLKTGDIIFFTKTSSIVNRVIAFMTSATYTHCAFIINANGTILLAESTEGKGVRIVNASLYSTRECVVFKRTIDEPSDSIFDETAFLASIYRTMGTISYSYFDALYVGIREFCINHGIPLASVKDWSGEICSEYITKRLNIQPAIISPQKLFDLLLKTHGVRE